MAAAYIGSNLLLNARYVRPANLRSVALDSRIGGALADSISANPTVKAFGAEAREEKRIAEVTGLWRRLTLVTWTRFINVWLFQNLILVVLQAGLTALLIDLWAKGQATAATSPSPSPPSC